MALYGRGNSLLYRVNHIPEEPTSSALASQTRLSGSACCSPFLARFFGPIYLDPGLAISRTGPCSYLRTSTTCLMHTRLGTPPSMTAKRWKSRTATDGFDCAVEERSNARSCTASVSERLR